MPVPGHDVEAYCLLCECKYEERSSNTIKVPPPHNFLLIFTHRKPDNRSDRLAPARPIGHHHHLPVCGRRSAALHALPAAGGSSDSQTRPVHAAAAQRGGLGGDSLNLSSAAAQAGWGGESLNLITSLARSASLVLHRRCVRRRWTAARPGGTRCWSGWRGRSSAGRSRSRSSARRCSTGTSC